MIFIVIIIFVYEESPSKKVFTINCQERGNTWHFNQRPIEYQMVKQIVQMHSKCSISYSSMFLFTKMQWQHSIKIWQYIEFLAVMSDIDEIQWEFINKSTIATIFSFIILGKACLTLINLNNVDKSKWLLPFNLIRLFLKS